MFFSLVHMIKFIIKYRSQMFKYIVSHYQIYRWCLIDCYFYGHICDAPNDKAIHIYKKKESRFEKPERCSQVNGTRKQILNLNIKFTVTDRYDCSCFFCNFARQTIYWKSSIDGDLATVAYTLIHKHFHNK